jgi:CDP-2,3-bis-(O-geranylgeranyl)-sn-glycerol synthase
MLSAPAGSQDIPMETFTSSTIILILQLMWFYLPVAVANMAPVLVQHHLTFLAKPVDFGATLVGKPIFGDHKTWRGIIAATVFGGVVFAIQYLLTIEYPVLRHWAPFDLLTGPWWFGFLFGFAAILGDLLKSFFKRRFAIEPGAVWFPFDQIDLYILSTLVAYYFYPVTAVMVILVFAIGMILHIVVNHLGHALGIKDTPW